MGRITEDGLLTVEIDRQPERWLVHVAGELDLSNVEVLERALVNLNGQPVVLDLSHLEFMDSSGLALLMRRFPEGLRVQNASGQVESLLQLCAMDTVLA